LHKLAHDYCTVGNRQFFVQEERWLCFDTRVVKSHSKCPLSGASGHAMPKLRMLQAKEAAGTTFEYSL